MSNQTIDGVPRELLEVMLTAHQAWPSYDKARKELRALLDAPSCNTPSGNACPGDGAGPCKWCPAVQPPDHLVATAIRDLMTRVTSCHYEIAEPAMEELRTIMNRPPAQAPVMPERNTDNYGSFRQVDYAQGWNACIEEVRRLNPQNKGRSEP